MLFNLFLNFNVKVVPSPTSLATLTAPSWISIICFTLTGQQINDLLATGYDAYGNGKGYPYVMASPVQPEADKTYQVAICGVSDQLAAEADVVDSGVVGMDAAKAFFGAYTSISRADTAWS